jgi:hypothetical protein
MTYLVLMSSLGRALCSRPSEESRCLARDEWNFLAAARVPKLRNGPATSRRTRIIVPDEIVEFVGIDTH